MEHKISFAIVYMEHKIFFMITSALLLIRIAWLGITETEYEKNDNKNHLRIFQAHFWCFSQEYEADGIIFYKIFNKKTKLVFY